MRPRVIPLVLAALLGCAGQRAHVAAGGRRERTSRVPVAPGVELEVVDWGGVGAPVVFLAGLGFSAHVFDGFAPRLADRFHVLGISRRGHGASSTPDSGYDSATLAADVVAMLDALQIERPVLVGHSFAGPELTWIGINRAGRVAGLVYLDAAFDYTQEDTCPDPPMPRRRPEDLRSLETVGAWYAQALCLPLPTDEVRARHLVGADGSVVGERPSKEVRQRIFEGVLAPDYARIRLPVLAVVVQSRASSAEEAMGVLGCAYRSLDGEGRKLAQEYFEKCYPGGASPALTGLMERLRREMPDARVLDWPRAAHRVFLSDPDDLERELRSFFASLR